MGFREFGLPVINAVLTGFLTNVANNKLPDLILAFCEKAAPTAKIVQKNKKRRNSFILPIVCV